MSVFHSVIILAKRILMCVCMCFKNCVISSSVAADKKMLSVLPAGINVYLPSSCCAQSTSV